MKNVKAINLPEFVLLFEIDKLFFVLLSMLFVPFFFHIIPQNPQAPLGAIWLPIFYAPLFAVIYFKKHVSFLAEGTSDPRPKFMQALRDNLGDAGSILVYNQAFERGVMDECATALPEFREWYDENIGPRIKDLLDVFREFHYYDLNLI